MPGFSSNGVPNVPKSMPVVRNFQSGETPSFEYPYSITGVTKDSNGAALATAIVRLYRTADDSYVHQTTSDANGNYVIPASQNLQHYCNAYKAGSPDVAGTTVNTLVGT
jgi:hypothetical protein